MPTPPFPKWCSKGTRQRWLEQKTLREKPTLTRQELTVAADKTLHHLRALQRAHRPTVSRTLHWAGAFNRELDGHARNAVEKQTQKFPLTTKAFSIFTTDQKLQFLSNQGGMGEATAARSGIPPQLLFQSLWAVKQILTARNAVSSFQVPFTLGMG